ncbi:hypothetical protein [Sinomonas sp. P47F7]|uniref:hypothetical protein n=1 Tax=Sinomonas sp. P47F7 TaxID=3410987 RepID=UPI003BF57B8A
MAVTPEIETAIAEIQDQHPDANVSFIADGDGGAFVTVDTVPLESQYSQAETWIKFHITVNYPVADVYPHFIDPAVRIKDSTRPETTPLGEGTSLGNFQFAGAELRAIQVSRRSNQLDSAVDSAALKLAKVLYWLEART